MVHGWRPRPAAAATDTRRTGPRARGDACRLHSDALSTADRGPRGSGAAPKRTERRGAAPAEGDRQPGGKAGAGSGPAPRAGFGVAARPKRCELSVRCSGRRRGDC